MVKKPSCKKINREIDAEISRIYYRLAENVSIDVLKINSLFARARDLIGKHGFPAGLAVAQAAVTHCEPSDGWRIADRYACSQGHASTSQGTSHECAICGLSGYRSSEGLVGEIFTKPCTSKFAPKG